MIYYGVSSRYRQGRGVHQGFHHKVRDPKRWTFALKSRSEPINAGRLSSNELRLSRESRLAQCAQSHDLKKEVSCMLDEPPLKPA